MSFGDAEARALVTEAFRIADEEIVPRFRALGAGEVDVKSRHDDLVTIADRRAEERLTDWIAHSLPGLSVVGEEAVSADAGVLDRLQGDGTCVIVDPVDGTWNFANGVPLFGVILAVAEAGRTVWGAILDPLTRTRVEARRGGGAVAVAADGSTRPLRLSDAPADLAGLSGYAHAFLMQGETRRRLLTRLADLHRVDALRCSAVEYRLLAEGRADFCLSGVLNPWDHAAGCLIAREAGGVARIIGGDDYEARTREGRLLTARSEAAWQALAAHLAGV